MQKSYVIKGLYNNKIVYYARDLVGRESEHYELNYLVDIEAPIIEIIVMYFVAPAVIAFGVATAMRKLKLIKDGDMKINV